MSKRKALVIGLAVLSALAFSAVAASGASAAGTTAYTCVKGGGSLDREGEHCETAVSPGSGLYGHELIPVGTTTETAITGGAYTMKGEIGTVKVTISCTSMTGTGSIKNEVIGTEMVNHGKEVKLTFEGCTVAPAALKCQVVGGQVKTVSMTSITKEMEEEFKPEAGNVFAEFSFEKCTNTGLNTKYTVEGHDQGIPNGSTIENTAASSSGLIFAGHPATLEGKSTVKMPGGNGIALTTD